jgi:hypothetical protein
MRAGCCEHANELSMFLKYGQLLDEMSKFLKDFTRMEFNLISWGGVRLSPFGTSATT